MALNIKLCNFCNRYEESFCISKYIDRLISGNLKNYTKTQMASWIKEHTVLDGTIFSLPSYISPTLAIISLRCPEYLDMYEKYLLLK